MRFHPGTFPREGCYTDPIIFFTIKTLLRPALTLCALIYVKLTSQWPGLERPIFWSAIISVAIWINEFLSYKSRNNWTIDPTYDWTKEIVVVTGGSSGIGATVVERLLADKVSVIVFGFSQPNIARETKHMSYHRCDLSDEKEIRAVCTQVREEVGQPTILVNNAGLSRRQTVAEGTYHDNSITLRTNILAPTLLTKEFLPRMIEDDHGHIVNLASMSAYLPPAGLADYSASKAGLIAFHEALGLELKYRHAAPTVRTSLAILSFTKTPLFKGEMNQSNFLFPLMHVDTIGDAIVDTVYSGSSRTMYFPGIFRYFAGIRGAPELLQAIIRSGSQSLRWISKEGNALIQRQASLHS